jgi:hypothetical protein
VHKEIDIATSQTSNNGKVGTKNKGPRHKKERKWKVTKTFQK